MEQFLLLVAALFLTTQSSFTQERQEALNFPNNPELKEFNDAANSHQDDLLFKALWYTAPYSRLHYALGVARSGFAYPGREVPPAHQDARSGRLSEEQMEEIRRMLRDPRLRPSTVPLKPQEGEIHTAIVFFNRGGYTRYDYVGALPSGVQVIIDFIKSEIEEQERRQSEEELRKRGEQSTPQP